MPNEDEQQPRPPLGVKGCLGEFIGEGLFYLGAAVLAGLLVLAARGIDVLLQRHAVVGIMALALLVVAFVYGLVWSIRLRPGLYLENLRGDPVRQNAFGTRHRRVRIAGMIYLQVVCLTVAGYLFTVVVWSRP